MAVVTAEAREYSWEPPGPGSWRRDLHHFPAPPTAHLIELFPAFTEGFRHTAERYGWMINGVEIVAVNGILYGGMIPMPLSEFPTRAATAERVFTTKLWREDVHEWDTKVKPATMRLHRALIDVDPLALDADALATYVERCRDHHYAMWRQHHVFNGSHWIPVGDFVTAAVQWTGLPPARVALLLKGASPISRGHCPEAEAVARVIDRFPNAGALIDDEGSDAGTVVDALRAMDGPVADAIAGWLAIAGYRLIEGFDISFPYALERPALLVAALRAARREAAPVEDEQLLAQVRDAVPDEHRDDFDDRYAEARHSFHVRDERGIYSDAIAAGLARRAWLAAGARLADAGVLPNPELAIDATAAELRDALAGRARAGFAAELAARAAFRAVGIPDAPAVLGPPDTGPPPLDGLPPFVIRMMTAAMGLPDEMGKAAAAPEAASDDGAQLDGVAASPGTYRGIARIVRTPDDLDRLEDGAVMITITTGEAFNVAIALVGALVTEVGGIMSHAGITAREYGVPAVVNVTGATTIIPDGALVEVDGSTGTVRRV
jgi:pyruvate,water dikinase